ncbi:MAG: tetratricopeptide repeat protein, partial [Chitinispirillaceae bacterium]|nr:tetratricopeptide repeat protein [Chitinispirillaceae bacterium]
KYNKQKQELREDPVLDGLMKTKDLVQKHNSTVIGTLSVAVVIVGLVSGYNYFKNSRISQARNEFGKAMVLYNDQKLGDAIDQFRAVAEKYRSTVTGTISAYMLGSILNQQGRYDEAITWYEAVGKGTNAGFVNAQAWEGLATAYEMKNDTAAALKYLEKALTDDRIAYRHAELRWKAALLYRASDTAKAIALCDNILNDTLATAQHQNAEFLKAMLGGGTGR